MIDAIKLPTDDLGERVTLKALVEASDTDIGKILGKLSAETRARIKIAIRVYVDVASDAARLNYRAGEFEERLKDYLGGEDKANRLGVIMRSVSAD